MRGIAKATNSLFNIECLKQFQLGLCLVEIFDLMSYYMTALALLLPSLLLRMMKQTVLTYPINEGNCKGNQQSFQYRVLKTIPTRPFFSWGLQLDGLLYDCPCTTPSLLLRMMKQTSLTYTINEGKLQRLPTVFSLMERNCSNCIGKLRKE